MIGMTVANGCNLTQSMQAPGSEGSNVSVPLLQASFVAKFIELHNEQPLVLPSMDKSLYIPSTNPRTTI